MDQSLFAVLNDAVASDAARLSGRRFADARGAGIARRVRTRRTVRAVGAGGASAVAVGALAVGATQMPWVSGTEVAAVPTDCATPWPSPSEAASPFVVVKNYADSLAETWIVSDAASGEPLFTMTAEEPGTSWTVTYPSGLHEVVEYSRPGEVDLNVPGAGEVVVSVAVNDGATEVAVRVPTSAPVEPSPSASEDCYTPSPTPSSVLSPTPTPAPSPSPDPTPAPIATVVSKPEDVVAGTNPFQCGFPFPGGAQATDTLSIAVSADDPSGTSVTVTDRFASSLGEVAWIATDAVDPVTVANAAPPSGYGAVQSGTFVAVVDGVVVGTIVNPYASSDAPPLSQGSLGTNFDFTLSLLTPDTAFTACPGITLGNDWTAYAVAGDVALDSSGATHGPVYAWLKLGED